MRVFFVLILLLLNGSFLPAQQAKPLPKSIAPAKNKILLKGTVTGFDGKPMAKADVHLQQYPWFANEMRRYDIEVKRDGTYEFKLPPGRYTIGFSGANHQMTMPAPVFFTSDSVQTVDARLALNRFIAPSDDFDSLYVVYDIFDFSRAGRAELLMERKSRGVYRLRVDTVPSIFAYQISGIVPDRTVNGTMSDGFDYDYGGDYHSLVFAQGKPVMVEFDFSRLPKPDPADTARAYVPVVEGLPLHHSVAKAQEDMHDLDTLSRAFARVASAGDTVRMRQAIDLFSMRINNIVSCLKDSLHTIDSMERQAAFVTYLHAQLRISYFRPWHFLLSTDSALTEHAFYTLAPESPWWNLTDAYLGYAVSTAVLERRMAYVESILRNNPSEKVIIDALRSLTAHWNALASSFTPATKISPKSGISPEFIRWVKDTTVIPRAVAIAKMRVKSPGSLTEINSINPDRREYVKDIYRQSARQGIDTTGLPGAPLKNGDRVPVFSFALVSDTTKTVSNTAYAGKVYLIDFWATWCGPCIGELPGLKKAYDKYKDKGFEIVSLSSDGSPDAVKKFLENKTFPMPWVQGWVGSRAGRKLSLIFGVIGIPKPFLIDRDGRIVAMDVELRGEGLDRELSKRFE